MFSLIVFVAGSSPLTRGKPALASVRSPRPRLIPAHAGKTACQHCHEGPGEAHPRSRGENKDGAGKDLISWGSSPLTRGKRAPGDPAQALIRLIPAHAGKTVRGNMPGVTGGAHPRSRGENTTIAPAARATSGSSPLTRGKQLCELPGGRGEGLIPAHAGKTAVVTPSIPIVAAHPRSRGENR